MAADRTAWHYPFVALVLDRRPKAVEVFHEVQLTVEPQRADLLLLRQGPTLTDPLTDPGDARIFRSLWPRLASDTLAEFKSTARPFRQGDLMRLIGYAAQYNTRQIQRLKPRDLTLVLFVHDVTPTLRREVAWLGLSLTPLKDGYFWIEGGMYRMYVVAIEQVARAEQDDWVALFGRRKVNNGQAYAWLQQFIHRARKDKNMQNEMENEVGWQELVERWSEFFAEPGMAQHFSQEARMEVIKTSTVEQRLAGISAQDRLAGISVDELQRYLQRLQSSQLSATN